MYNGNRGNIFYKMMKMSEGEDIMKKLLCFLVTLIMLMQCTSFVFAEETGAETFAGVHNVTPYLDMEVKVTGSSEFENGPLSLRGSSATVSYKTTLEMETVYAEFLKWYERAVDIIDILAADETEKTALTTAFENLPIEGGFTVVIKYPNFFEVPAEFLADSQQMYGFNEEAKAIFYEIKRESSEDSDGDKLLTITIGVKGASSETLKVKELYDNREAYLADITLTAEGVTISKTGKHTVSGTMEGYTEAQGTFSGTVKSLRVDYAGIQNPAEEKVNPEAPSAISATVELKRESSGGSRPTVELIFNVDGDTNLVAPIEGQSPVKFEELPIPTKPGYVFDGWYYDSARTQKVEEDVVVPGRIILYGHFMSEMLNSEDHFAYVIGYPDGLVRPTGNITREEVATIFYRLLREDKLVTIASTTNNFTDVEKERWSNKAISSLANGGYITGYEDGTFGPSKFITRAEFATMATRYASLSLADDVAFSDIEGHWAKDYILKASSAGWVNGYEDGTFAPEKYITRAEVMTIINRMLTRYVDAEGLHVDTKLWADMDGTEWYYFNVLEATNAHNYVRREDGKLEKWTEITPNKIWIELDEMEEAE